MEENSVTAVIVTYNRLDLLKECIESLLSQTHLISHMIVIDNDSVDGTKEYLDFLVTTFSNIQVRHLKQNIGGAAGFELGVREAIEQLDDKYIWIMDDDTIPKEDACQRLIEKAHTLDRFGFLCSDVRWTDGTATNIPSVTDRWPERAKEGLISVSNATFVSIIVKRETVIQYGLPNAGLVIWGDDTEFTTRITQTVPSYYVIHSTVIHKTVTNLSNLTIANDDYSRVERYKYMYRNLIFIDRKYHIPQKVIKRILTELRDGLIVIISAKDHKFNRFRAVLSGLILGLFFNPKINFAKQHTK